MFQKTGQLFREYGFLYISMIQLRKLKNGIAEIIRLADWDTVKTNKFANRAIAYLLNCENEKLPKEIMVAFK